MLARGDESEIALRCHTDPIACFIMDREEPFSMNLCWNLVRPHLANINEGQKLLMFGFCHKILLK
jgi:hypothetical protein